MERDDVGIVSITDIETGAEIVKERDFWFAWYAFHPETDVYRMKLQEEYMRQACTIGVLGLLIWRLIQILCPCLFDICQKLFESHHKYYSGSK